MSAYWEARFDPPKMPEHSACEVRVRIYDSVGLDTFYREEEGRDGAYAVASDAWCPFELFMLDQDERALYEAIRGKFKN
jgi:hypothetical protein